MFEYELHQQRTAELAQAAEHDRLVREARKAARAGRRGRRGNETEGRVTPGRITERLTDRFTRAA
ncbi:hypothetical protein [Streptomyces flavofungini]|uniref:Uncharacterized protein n=1 Tax=Streptomyces flavofungini TaxID=68200 RepID=A0ABS0WZP2_9ACTN|nr:hypothetical protein [Streptomyces flavofungini]MBJ3806363.1 hypothetical protein [Streptomyces flavofungini]GHC45648.1 hypothetical protein GCM10010349_07960 [Streptomyces flavofungini]